MKKILSIILSIIMLVSMGTVAFAGDTVVSSVYSLDANPDLAKKRQEKVIECMKECGYEIE